MELFYEIQNWIMDFYQQNDGTRNEIEIGFVKNNSSLFECR